MRWLGSLLSIALSTSNGVLRSANGGELQFFNALEGLSNSVAFEKYLGPAANTEWVVYAKPPFGGPQQVLKYLGRYAHRVAISNNRLLDFSDGDVTFAWKDYRHESRSKTMQLDGDEFIRRFLLHVLPSIPANPPLRTSRRPVS
jgi:hypothetical protein